MKRLLLLVGPVISLLGAVGLLWYGRAIVDVFGGVLTMRNTDPFEPMAASLTELRWAAISGMALTFGLAVSCIAVVMRDNRKLISIAGKVLCAAAGVLTLIGAMTVAWAVFGVRAGFVVIASSGMAPRAENVREIVQASSPRIALGCVVLLLGAVAVFVAGQGGFGMQSRNEAGNKSLRSMAAAVFSVILGVISCLLFIAVWVHSNELEELLLSSGVKPGDLATHLSGISTSPVRDHPSRNAC